MAIFDVFKKKKTASAPLSGATAGKGKKEVHEVKPPAAPAVSKPKKISGQAYGVIKRPHVTEKATDLTSQNQYIFEVFEDSNKNQVKKAVEDVYGVDVVSVNIVNIPRKRKRLGRIEGWSGGCKKAIVKIKEGQKIEVLPR